MAAELRLAPEVEWDVLEAYAWYEGRRPGLGEEFMTCIDACIQNSENTVTVYCVFHTARDPAKWRQVLQSRSQP